MYNEFFFLNHLRTLPSSPPPKKKKHVPGACGTLDRIREKTYTWTVASPTAYDIVQNTISLDLSTLVQCGNAQIKNEIRIFARRVASCAHKTWKRVFSFHATASNGFSTNVSHSQNAKYTVDRYEFHSSTREFRFGRAKNPIYYPSTLVKCQIYQRNQQKVHIFSSLIIWRPAYNRRRRDGRRYNNIITFCEYI